jgi:hypothetical protein
LYFIVFFQAAIRGLRYAQITRKHKNKDRPISHVVGGHLEKNGAGELFTWQSTHHPGERALPLGKADVLALPAALRSFNGFYTETAAS